MYIVAKNKDKNGCIAYMSEDRTEIANTVRLLNGEGHKGLEVMGISRPEAYGEYAPYVIVSSIEEFIDKARELMI